ncbi:restriction endonuclease [Streptomyces sp. cmx-18-6]|uniref:restriction endonuclease n=1 Tax=Streptomyces sp. cmx-18-6 TaxID=2790930 RepID=UPI0039809227
MAETPHRTVPPRPTRISSWQQAEHNAARWMNHWGYAGATARPGGPDSGIDVHAAGALGQVKYQAAQVGRPDLQRFVGARPHGSTAQLIFFTGSGYTATAVVYAEERTIALFTYRLDGTMTPVNDTARRIHRSAAASASTAASASAASTAPVASTASMAVRDPGTAGGQTFWQRNWRVVVGVLLLMAPLGSIGDEKTYTGPLILDILKFVGILLACWAIGTFLIAARFGFRVSLRIRPLRVALVPRSGAGPTTAANTVRVPRPTRARPGPRAAASGARQDDLVAEAARLLRTGSKQHHIDKDLRDRGIGFMDRGRILSDARKLNKRP